MFGDWFSTIKINLFGHKQSCICLQYVFVVMEKMNNFSQAAKWQILLFYNFPKIHSISYFIQNIVQKKNISFCSLQTIPSLNEKTHLRRYTSLEYNFFSKLKRHYLGYPNLLRHLALRVIFFHGKYKNIDFDVMTIQICLNWK